MKHSSLGCGYKMRTAAGLMLMDKVRKREVCETFEIADTAGEQLAFNCGQVEKVKRDETVRT